MKNLILTESQLKYLTEITCGEINDKCKEVNLTPTDAQKEASNYKMAHISVKGMRISIENPVGSKRYYEENGEKKYNVMKNHYGYFNITKGKDGDAVDVFLGPNIEEFVNVYCVDQNNKKGEFDETKVMLGFNSKEEAKKAYFDNFSPDWKGFRKITGVPLSFFKKWLYRGRKQRQPFGDYVEVKKKQLKENKQLLNILTESFSSPLLSKFAKEHGGIKVGRNGGLRDGTYSFHDGDTIDVSKITDDMLYGEPFKFDYETSSTEQRKNHISFNDGYAVMLKPFDLKSVPEKKRKPSRYGTGIGDTGDHDKSLGGFVGDGKIQKSAPYNGYMVSDKTGELQGYRQAINNNRAEISDIEKEISKLDNELKRETDYNRILMLQSKKKHYMKQIMDAQENIRQIRSYYRNLIK